MLFSMTTSLKFSEYNLFPSIFTLLLIFCSEFTFLRKLFAIRFPWHTVNLMSKCRECSAWRHVFAYRGLSGGNKFQLMTTSCLRGLTWARGVRLRSYWVTWRICSRHQFRSARARSCYLLIGWNNSETCRVLRRRFVKTRACSSDWIQKCYLSNRSYFATLQSNARGFLWNSIFSHFNKTNGPIFMFLNQNVHTVATQKQCLINCGRLRWFSFYWKLTSAFAVLLVFLDLLFGQNLHVQLTSTWLVWLFFPHLPPPK